MSDRAKTSRDKIEKDQFLCRLVFILKFKILLLSAKLSGSLCQGQTIKVRRLCCPFVLRSRADPFVSLLPNAEIRLTARIPFHMFSG